MAVNSIRQLAHWQMPNIIWQMVVASVILHVTIMFYMLQDFTVSDSEPVLSGHRNIVFKATLETRKMPAIKKTEKIIKQSKQNFLPRTSSLPIRKLKTVKKIEPMLKPVPRVENKIERRMADTKIIEQRTEIMASKMMNVDAVYDASVTAQKSYVPPHSDASYLSNPKPFYPRAARRRGMQGMVMLEVEVSIEGMPKKVEIEMSSGFKLLDIAAVETVRGWRFVPAHRDGVAVVALVDVPVRFVLNEAN